MTCRGSVVPDWKAVIERDYHPWDRDHVTVDTAGRSLEECVAQVLARVLC